MCYTCVRECPAKAIRIVEQQAEVIPERCIGCGNCVRVCSQHAKRVESDLAHVWALLESKAQVAAIVAPSFPAEFVRIDFTTFVGMLRRLGFSMVNEVAFGADLVAAEYRHLLERSPDQRYIATSCPAIIGYVERYHPALVPALAPIVSPMIATSRALHRLHGDKLQIVFIGPCIAKKGEATSDPVLGEVNAVMTFIELQQLFEMAGVTPEQVEPSDFDPPHGAHGGLFPISRGMLQAADIGEDLMAGEVVAADGHHEFSSTLFASSNPAIWTSNCWNACAATAVSWGRESASIRRSSAGVPRSAATCGSVWATLDRAQWKHDLAEYMQCDLTRGYMANDQRVERPSEEQVQQVLRRMGKTDATDELNCGACGYETCRDHAIAICRGLAESEMCLPYTIDELRKTCGELTLSNEQLESTKEALLQSEKTGQHGAACGRHRPRSQQPARHGTDALACSAG